MYLSSLRAISFLLGISYNDSQKMLIDALCEDKANIEYSIKHAYELIKEKVKFALKINNEIDREYVYCYLKNYHYILLLILMLPLY